MQTMSHDGDPPKSPLVRGNRKLHVEGNLIPLGRTGYTSAAEWVIANPMRLTVLLEFGVRSLGGQHSFAV